MADITVNAALVIGSNAATRRREFLLGYLNAKAGDIVFTDANNKWQKVQSNVANTGTNFADNIGILETGGNTNQPATAITYDPNLSFGGSILSNGVAYYASPNAGAISNGAPGSGNVAQLLFVARTQSTAFFNPTASGATI